MLSLLLPLILIITFGALVLRALFRIAALEGLLARFDYFLDRPENR